MSLASQVNNRIPELLSQNAQLRLRISVDTISRITPLLLNSYKVMLKDSKSDNVLSSKDIICNILQGTCREVDKIVSDTTPETLETSKGGILTQKMVKVENYQFVFKQLHSKKQYKEAFNQLEKYLKSYNRVLEYIKDYLPIIYDPYQKQSISSTITLLKRKEVDFLELMKKCQSSNYPYSLRNQLIAELEYRTEYLHFLKDLFNKCVINSIVILTNEIANSTNEDSILGIYVKNAKAGTLNNVTLEPYHQQQLENYIESQNIMHQLKKHDTDSGENKNVNDNGSGNDNNIDLDKEIQDDTSALQNNLPIIKALKIYKDEFTFIFERVVSLLSTNNLQIHKNIIFNRIDTIDHFFPLVIKTGLSINNNTEEPNFNLFFDNVINVWEYLVNDVKSYIINQEGIFSMKDLLDSSSLNINGHIKAICKKEDNDVENLQVEYKSILATVNQLIDISKNECNNTEDLSYREKLKKSVKDIKNEMKLINKNMNNREVKDSTRETFEKFNEALNSEDTSILVSDMTFIDINQTSEEQKDELERLKVVETKKHLSNLKNEVDTLDQIIRINRRYAISKELPPTPPVAMKKSKSSDYLQLISSKTLTLNNNKNENVGSPLSQEISNQQSQPSPSADQSFYYQSQLADKNAIIQPLNKEDAQKNPILAVACDLKMAASKQRLKDNPIIEIADLIAQKLDELSYYNQVIRSNPKAKKMLIRIAQEMMDKCVSALNYAKEISETCTDKRLKLQLQNTIERIKTIGQQLKVVIAVKSGGRFGMDGDKQLVTCASNLVEAVKSLLNDSEAACLRSNYLQSNGKEGKGKGKEKENENENENENEKEKENVIEKGNEKENNNERENEKENNNDKENEKENMKKEKEEEYEKIEQEKAAREEQIRKAIELQKRAINQDQDQVQVHPNNDNDMINE